MGEVIRELDAGGRRPRADAFEKDMDTLVRIEEFVRAAEDARQAHPMALAEAQPGEAELERLGLAYFRLAGDPDVWVAEERTGGRRYRGLVGASDNWYVRDDGTLLLLATGHGPAFRNSAFANLMSAVFFLVALVVDANGWVVATAFLLCSLSVLLLGITIGDHVVSGHVKRQHDDAGEAAQALETGLTHLMTRIRRAQHAREQEIERARAATFDDVLARLDALGADGSAASGLPSPPLPPKTERRIRF
jgi:hypothetical protein